MRTAKVLTAILAVIIFGVSCASINLRPMELGEARLTGIEMPEMVREDLQYDVILSMDAEEMPQVRKICFRWVAEENSSASPSLHAFSIGSENSRGLWRTGLAGPDTKMASNLFCAEGQDIRTDIPGKLIVKIRPAALKAKYNKLEGQAEYISEGRVRTTNKVATRVLVQE